MLVNIYDAKTNLSALLDKAVAGEEIVIARAGKPLARLMPVTTVASKSGVRLGGLKRAKLKLAADFHAPMTDDDLLFLQQLGIRWCRIEFGEQATFDYMKSTAERLAVIDTRSCTGCGRCVAVCDPHLLSLEVVRWKKFAVMHEPERCTGCSACAVACPFHAITMRRQARVG